MYKNRYIIRGLKLVSLIGVMLLIALSCSNNDELNTDILASKQTTIKAFGPNPALRGQSLSVVGTHLDKISKVILPNNIEVTDIEFTDVSFDEPLQIGQRVVFCAGLKR